jgi:hypothetical protein
LADEAGVDAGAYGFDDARSLVADAGGQLGLFEIAAVHVHGFGAIEADGLDAEAEFAFAGLTRGCAFETEIFGATELVEADDFWHRNVSSVWFDEAGGGGIRGRARKF